MRGSASASSSSARWSPSPTTSPRAGLRHRGDPQAAVRALSQTFFHWGVGPWAVYGLVGAAVAYGAFRRGRVPLMSSILVGLVGQRRADGTIGRLVDMFAIVATLFGTSASLGIGAMQIGRGVELVAGIGRLPNAALIAIIAVLTAAFIGSAVSGIGRGIRWLSNINMVLALTLSVFIFIAGPTLFILNLWPAAIMDYAQNFFGMLGLGPAYGPEAAEFVGTWTVFYWAWWISWSPFVGIFLAKISRGRTLREFVIYVITMPTLVCMLTFGVLGGTSIWLRQQGTGISADAPAEELFFTLLGSLPSARSRRCSECWSSPSSSSRRPTRRRW
nr:BCCT family transporter [Tessaracoccus coleopterorum]